MKRETPGFVRELPIALLLLALILAFAFWPFYRHYKKRADNLRTTKAQEMELMDEMVEEAPGNLDTSESNEDLDGLAN